jgi:hypothetical protein
MNRKENERRIYLAWNFLETGLTDNEKKELDTLNTKFTKGARNHPALKMAKRLKHLTEKLRKLLHK